MGFQATGLNIRSAAGGKAIPVGFCTKCGAYVAQATSKKTGGTYLCDASASSSKAYPWRLHRCQG